jgi:hypothetical protein
MLELVELTEAPRFAQLLPDYLSDDDYRDFQIHLANNPEAGRSSKARAPLALRWADPRMGQGRRGGLRVNYYYFEQDMQIWFLTLYGKDEVVDLSPKEKLLLKAAINDETRQRAQRRALRRE